MQIIRNAIAALKSYVPPAEAIEAVSSISPAGQEIIAEMVHAKARREERLVRRMLTHWVSEVGEPVLVYDRHGELRGLGPDQPVGARVRIFVRADDFRDSE